MILTAPSSADGKYYWDDKSLQNKRLPFRSIFLIGTKIQRLSQYKDLTRIGTKGFCLSGFERVWLNYRTSVDFILIPWLVEHIFWLGTRSVYIFQSPKGMFLSNSLCWNVHMNCIIYRQWGKPLSIQVTTIAMSCDHLFNDTTMGQVTKQFKSCRMGPIYWYVLCRIHLTWSLVILVYVRHTENNFLF